MSKLSIRDKCILLALIFAVVLYGGYNFLWVPLNQQISEAETQKQELKSKIGDQTPLEKQIKELKEESAVLIKQISEYRQSQGGKSLNKEDFLVYLGKKCSESNAELIKFNDLGCTEEVSGVWKMQFDFELRGNLSSINRVCKAIDDIGIRYSVGGMSLRQNDGFSYLTRFFDGISKLEWYKDETSKEDEKPTEEVSPEDGFVFPDEFYNDNQPPADIPSANPPVTEPASPSVPSPEPTPTPTPEPKDENITDRLNKLLEMTSNTDNGYKIMLLTNKDSYWGGISNTDIMRLNITIQFIMYSDPADFSNSFLTENSEV